MDAIENSTYRQDRSHSWLTALKIASRRHFSPYKLYVRRDLHLAVALNPKVGSTTFRRVLVEGLQAVGAAPRLSRFWPMRLSRRYLTASPSEYLDLLRRPQRYQLHCFVRNPYARVLSAWTDKFTLDDSGEPKARSMHGELPVVRRFAQRNGLPGGDGGSAVPFATFIAYIESQPEGGRNQHWDTQSAVLACDTFHYNHIWKMETEFADGMTDILTHVGLSPDWVRQRVSKPNNASRKLTTPVYDTGIAERVYRIYDKDFETFGYERDSWQGM